MKKKKNQIKEKFTPISNVHFFCWAAMYASHLECFCGLPSFGAIEIFDSFLVVLEAPKKSANFFVASLKQAVS